VCTVCSRFYFSHHPIKSHVISCCALSSAFDEAARDLQNVVPTMAALKHVLERTRSPLLGALMTSLAHIIKDYRTEIDDILASNRQLAAELEFDLRQQETREEEEAAAAAASEEVQARMAEELTSKTGAGGMTVSTPHKGTEGSTCAVSAAPGSVLKSGVPHSIFSPAGGKSGRPATPVSIPRLAKKAPGAQAAASDSGALYNTMDHEDTCPDKFNDKERATRRSQRRSGTENVPVQLS